MAKRGGKQSRVTKKDPAPSILKAPEPTGPVGKTPKEPAKQPKKVTGGRPKPDSMGSGPWGGGG